MTETSRLMFVWHAIDREFWEERPGLADRSALEPAATKGADR